MISAQRCLSRASVFWPAKSGLSDSFVRLFGDEQS
jgi:hypothetical protein